MAKVSGGTYSLRLASGPDLVLSGAAVSSGPEIERASAFCKAIAKRMREQALRMSTIWAAYYLADEDTLGSIEPGKLADFVILDGDYMTVPEDKISDLKALMTVIDGRIFYEVPGQL